MKEDVLFKRTPFGGFSRVEVISYIQQLKENQQKYKVMIDEKDAINKKLTEDNVMLLRQVESLKKAADDSNRRLSEAETQLKNLQMKHEALEKKVLEANSFDENGKKLAEDTVKMCDELVETASETARGLVKKAESEYESMRVKINETASKIAASKDLSAEEIKGFIELLAEEIKNV